MNNVLVKVDKLLCSYFGLTKSETIPQFVKNYGKKLVILNTEPYKRSVQETPISKVNFETVNEENKEKLGVAIGKAIATNLIISFEDVIIKRENVHA
jgi:hypothetical protein